MNNVFIARAKLYNSVRQFFRKYNLIEVETPIMVLQPGVEAYIDYFSCQWLDPRGRTHPFFLRSSPELHMKRLLSEYPHIFQIARVFRNGGEFGPWHHPEFTLLEWYEKGLDLLAMIERTDALLKSIFLQFQRDSLTPVLKRKLVKMTVYEAFWRFTGIELIDNDQDLAKKAKTKNFISVRLDDDFETAFFKIMLDIVEPKLKELQYVCLYDYPPSQKILAEVIQGRAKRFEFYLNGVELCNGFQECLDRTENPHRLSEVNEKRQSIGKNKILADDDFYQSLNHIHSVYSGNALGLDRLLAILLGQQNLDAVLPMARSVFLTRSLPQ